MVTTDKFMKALTCNLKLDQKYGTCVFSGNSNPALSEKIANYLELPLARARVSRFSDGEVFTEIKENVRGVDVYVIQSTCAPVNDNLMELTGAI